MAGRIYDSSRWQKLRARKLRQQPTCEACAERGVLRPAQHVDHIKSIASGGPAYPDLKGVQALCAGCHSRKTSAVDRPDRRPGKGLMRGCDVNGWPLDPAHDWNAPGAGHHPDLPDERTTDAPIEFRVSSKPRGPGWA